MAAFGWVRSCSTYPIATSGGRGAPALHFWYDFLLGTAAFIANPDNQPFAVRIGMPF